MGQARFPAPRRRAAGRAPCSAHAAAAASDTLQLLPGWLSGHGTLPPGRVVTMPDSHQPATLQQASHRTGTRLGQPPLEACGRAEDPDPCFSARRWVLVPRAQSGKPQWTPQLLSPCHDTYQYGSRARNLNPRLPTQTRTCPGPCRVTTRRCDQSSLHFSFLHVSVLLAHWTLHPPHGFCSATDRALAPTTGTRPGPGPGPVHLATAQLPGLAEAGRCGGARLRFRRLRRRREAPF